MNGIRHNPPLSVVKNSLKGTARGRTDPPRGIF
uniref:Uncharacterized protein n=1 Tax=Myoviridae sp. ct1AP5 TaxID=2825017 RepID=A0A8S5UDW9_9CAUD|nr:MAG TPA: hypothetical protein [Myoviridae sp. ct1AP5]